MFKHRMHSLVLLLLLTAVSEALLAGYCFADDATSNTEKLQFFETKVRPILVDHCYECHSGSAKKLEASLRLDHGSFLASGGDSGSVIAEGNASLLLQAVRYEAYEMPPSGKLPDEEIAVLQKWVVDGAVWPDEPIPEMHEAKEAFDLAKRRSEHWAWQARTNPRVPQIASELESRPGTAIDGFVRQSLEAQGLKQNAKADRATLARRAYLDLIGAPPSIAELEAIIADSDAAWYEKMVDRLLASPQFGVRFARHWLDLVRYAESRGHEFDEDVPGATHYRNYVIRAINQDVPYSQFITEQIAGDLLEKPRIDEARGWNESLIATGFWHLGEWVHSPVDSRKDETDRFDNMIDVFSKSMLGLTVACARCHDHKFDAIGTDDYYALAGFLRSSHYRMVRFETAVEHQEIEADRALLRQSQQKDVKDKLLAVLKSCVEHPELSATLLTKMAERRGLAANANGANASWKFAVPLPSEDPRLRTDYAKQPNAGSGAWISEGPGFGLGPVSAKSIDLEASDASRTRWHVYPAARFDSYWSRLKSSVASINSKNGYSQIDTSGRTLLTPTFELSSGELSYLIRGQCQAFVAVDSMRLLAGPLHGETRREFREDKSKLELHGGYRWVTQPLQRYKGKRVHVEFAPIDGQPFEVVQVIDGGAPAPLVVEASAVNVEQLKRVLNSLGAPEQKTQSDQVLIGSAVDAIQVNAGDWLAPDSSEAMRAYRAAIESWKQSLDQLAARTRWDSQVAMAMIDGTGENHPVLIRGSAENEGPMVERRFLTALDGQQVAEHGSGRLQLAREITDPRNPLTARVLVNRLWHHLLGRGIVATTDDFGVQGQRPTHPELLDHLANRLIEHDWSVKQMVRSILLSDVYQLSSSPNASARELDPGNLWLTRARVRRLEAEAIRDTLMSIAGRLDWRLEGGSVPVHLTEFLEGRGRPGVSGPADGEFRRSLYISVRRNFLVPMMSTFDSPNPFSSMGRRNVSSVPAQSLTLLNDPFVHQLAKFWSQAILEQANLSDEQRLEQIYLTAFSRRPTSDEQAAAIGFIAEQVAAGRSQQDVWQDVTHVVMNIKELILRF